MDELPWQSTGAEPLDLSQFRGLLTADGDLWDISGTVLQVRRGRLATLPVVPRW